MRKGRYLLMVLFAAVFAVGFNGTAVAVPFLQLDISDGTYDSSTETIVTGEDNFTLYALLKEGVKTPISDKYYPSVALTGPVSGSLELGSVSVGSQTYDVTGDMVYGVPPVEDFIGHDPKDLPKHSIFPTLFFRD